MSNYEIVSCQSKLLKTSYFVELFKLIICSLSEIYQVCYCNFFVALSFVMFYVCYLELPEAIWKQIPLFSLIRKPTSE
jgi:hypothetical protein